MPSARSRSVISKTLRTSGSPQAIASSPPSGRRRLTAPISVPSVVESMNVAEDRSTSTRVEPPSMAALSAAFSVGAVERSASPLTLTTLTASPWFVVDTSKPIPRGSGYPDDSGLRRQTERSRSLPAGTMIAVTRRRTVVNVRHGTPRPVLCRLA